MGETLTIGSLFSGIGGLELGLERAGLGPVLWQIEIDPFCREVLAKHWPNVTRYTDVTTVDTAKLARVDVICGGFPCQDVSAAGKGAGLAGARSGLWREFARIIKALAPPWVVVENVASGARRWLPFVRRDLHVLGYRTRAFALSAAAVGAPHIRRRVFVVAHPGSLELREQPRRRRRESGQGPALALVTREAGRTDGHADRDSKPACAIDEEVAGVCGVAGSASSWTSPPEFRRVDDGVPADVDRLRALGNAVVPQCAEVIGRVIREIRNP